MNIRKTIALCIFVVSAMFPFVALAITYSSANFQVTDPVVDVSGGRKTSSNFILIEATGQHATGISNSSSYALKSGFLYFTDPQAQSGGGGSSGGGSIDNVPYHILPFIRPLVPYIPPEVIESIVSHLPCPAGFPKEDVNCDGTVGLVDFSIFLYLQGSDQRNRTANPADFNQDGFVDVQDLSILFSAWTEKLLSFDSTDSTESARGALSRGTSRMNALPHMPLNARQALTGAPQQETALMGSVSSVVRRDIYELSPVRWQDIASAFVVLILLRLIFMRIGL